MKMTSSERLAEAMERTRRHWREEFRQAAPAPNGASKPHSPAWTIAISRDAGANGSRIAEAVAQKLGWVVYDHKFLKLADEMGVTVPLLEAVDEKPRNWLQECLKAFACVEGISSSTYVQRLLTVLARLSAEGGCVILGRGGAQVLPKETTLRVRLVGPLDDRIANVQQKKGLSRQAAVDAVARVDAERSRFVRDHFHKDPADASGYDLVLNTSRFTPDECAEIVVTVLHQFQCRNKTQVAEEALAN